MSIGTLHIIGGGLIGSSLARAARHFGQADRVLISDQNPQTCKLIEKLGLADGVSQDAAELAGEADLIVLCVPPRAMEDVAKTILPKMKPGAILSDVGSVKRYIADSITQHLRDDIHFIPGHPIAGTENSGPEAGFATLFKNRWCILTPVQEDEAALAKLTVFWEGIGSSVEIMTPERHDTVLATTSHVPHLLAFALVGTAVDMERVTNNDVVKYSAGGFRDFTRIAASDPTMWRDVFLSNKDAVLEVVDRYIEDLSALKRAIRWDEGEHLFSQFERTRNIRRDIIDAGQDTAAPNFGRDGDKDE